MLESLNAICPGEEEIKLLANYDGDRAMLAGPE